MSKSPFDYSSIDVHELLAQRHQVAVIWSIEDAQEMRPDLTDEQAWDVLRYCRKVHDCNFGITWGLIDMAAATLFPESDEEGAGQ